MSIVRRTEADTNHDVAALLAAVCEALDSVVATRFWLKQYNDWFVGENVGAFGKAQWWYIASFLNALFQLRTDLSRFAGRDSIPAWFRNLIEWSIETERGFQLEEAERIVLQAFDRRLARGLVLFGDDYDPRSSLGALIWSSRHGSENPTDGFVVFERDESPDNRIGVGLRFYQHQREPIRLNLFHDIAEFREIDGRHLDLALYELSKLNATSHPDRLADVTQSSDLQALFHVRLTEAEKRIVEVLKRKDCRLTTTQIHSALEDVEPTSLGKVKQSLSFLVRIGILDNKQDAEPPGYGLGPNHGQTRAVSFD